MGGHVSVSGRDIYYYKCGVCRFVFTDDFDHFTVDDFKRVIYNDDYVKMDPDFVESRTVMSAKLVETLF